MKKYWHWLAVAGFMGMILMPKAHAAVCATKVQILSVGLNTYAGKPISWSVEYRNTDGTTAWALSEVDLAQPAGQGYLKVIQDVIKSRELVTLERKAQPTCAGDIGNWFDSITTGR